MNPRSLALALVALAVGLAAGYLLRPAATPTTPPASSERQVLYWYDPMHPEQHFDRPGRSPFMDMDLVPRYADDAATTANGVVIDARSLQNLGVRTAEVTRGALVPTLRVAGTVAFDADASAVVQARARGWLQRVETRRPLQAVQQGDTLAWLVAPEWQGALAEYQAVRTLAGPEVAALRQAARQRLDVLGIPATAIAAVERGGQVPTRIALPAPRAGVLTEIDARDGQAVEAGQALFRINGVEQVWIEAAVPEADVAALQAEQPARISVPAWPGRVFEGRVDAVLPQVDATTRTLPLRIEIANADRALAPGMYATVELEGTATAPQLLVPDEALIPTGTRTVVLVETAPGRFLPHEVRTGAQAGGQTTILAGLAEGDRVVVSGQFLIDSEASLRGALQRLAPPAADAHDHGAAMPAPVAHDHAAMAEPTPAITVHAHDSAPGATTPAAPAAGHAGHGSREAQAPHDAHEAGAAHDGHAKPAPVAHEHHHGAESSP